MRHPILAALAGIGILFGLTNGLRAEDADADRDLDLASIEGEYDDTAGFAAFDPLAPYNRVVHGFNDRLYLWVLDPLARGYAWAIPEAPRRGVDNFFENLGAPVRVCNNLFQLKPFQAGRELARFANNTTFGVLGFSRAAEKHFGLAKYDEDFGQTLGVCGLGGGPYVVWPFLGPSNLRDTVGLVGDALLSPTTYLTQDPPGLGPGLFAGRSLNSASLRLGDYQEMKKGALDPYLFFRDAYTQNRASHIEK
ncbi:MAG: putative phospholipid-binding lipoprotein MlaA precursor [Lentisphaerae bacterium ADurb.BinA184]|nr:MAG: putative phospholipid-binding lipoprotein MlaA precursor [Lentisphaerae bacterium ADurb.BinA184]